MSEISDRIAEYEEKLSLLRLTMFEDDLDWKDLVEALVVMLVTDRVEILRRKDEMLRGVDQ